MRSVATAKRLRVLCAFISIYAILMALGGIAGGVLVATYHRITAAHVSTDGTFYVPQSSSYPYIWAGVAVAVASVVLATFVLVIADLIRLRANIAIEDRQPGRARARSVDLSTIPTPSAARAAAPRPTRPPPPPNGRRVRILTDDEKAALAATPPPRIEEGWYPDPFDAGALRRWNGVQWTGEQQAISLPPR